MNSPEPKKGSTLRGGLVLIALILFVMVAFAINFIMGLASFAAVLLLIGLSLHEDE